jgi:hypothetical protein
MENPIAARASFSIPPAAMVPSPDMPHISMVRSMFAIIKYRRMVQGTRRKEGVMSYFVSCP